MSEQKNRNYKNLTLLIWLSLTTACILTSGFALAGANQWTSVGLDGATISSIAIDPISPATLYAGTQGFGIFKSIDGGESWDAINEDLTYLVIRSLAIDCSDPQMIYGCTDGGGFGFITATTVGFLTYQSSSTHMAFVCEFN